MVRSSESHSPCAAFALTSESLSRRDARSTAVKSNSMLCSANSVIWSINSRLRSTGDPAKADMTSGMLALASPES